VRWIMPDGLAGTNVIEIFSLWRGESAHLVSSWCPSDIVEKYGWIGYTESRVEIKVEGRLTHAITPSGTQ
jgi:hypothetical protein